MSLTSRQRFGLLLLLCSLTLFFGLGRIALMGSDEPRYAEIGREMWVHNDFVSPKLAGRLWLEKAPLTYWGMAFFYSIFGATELAARLPSAFGALFVVLALWGTVKKAIDERTAYYVGIVAATNVAMVVFAHAGTTDMPLCATIFGALLCLWNAVQSEKRSFAWILGMGAFAAGSMLAKGLIGPLLITLITGIWWGWARPKLRVNFLQILATLVVFFAVCAIWYAPIWIECGRYFWDEFFVNQHFKRYTSNEYNHPQPFYFYIVIAPFCTLPWMPWFIAAVRDFPYLQPRSSQRDALLALAWVWAIVPIAFFSLSGSKLPSYILPSFPALSVLVGEALSRGVFLPRGWKPKQVAIGGSVFMVVFLFAAFLGYAPRYEKKHSTKALCLQVLAQMKPNELATLLLLPKDYDEVFYLQGRMVPGTGKRDIFYANDAKEFVPMLKKGSLIVFVNNTETDKLTHEADFDTTFLAKDGKLSAYRLTER